MFSFNVVITHFNDSASIKSSNSSDESELEESSPDGKQKIDENKKKITDKNTNDFILDVVQFNVLFRLISNRLINRVYIGTCTHFIISCELELEFVYKTTIYYQSFQCTFKDFFTLFVLILDFPNACFNKTVVSEIIYFLLL